MTLFTENEKLKVAILGATGTVGQHLIALLENHPWFKITAVAASSASKGKRYEEAVLGRWSMPHDIPSTICSMVLHNVQQIDLIAQQIDIVFCAIDLDSESTKMLEHAYAQKGVWVTSCNSAYRTDPLVPMILPLVNPHHLNVIALQRKQKGYSSGAIMVKSNCSIQSYCIALQPLQFLGIEEISVCSMQAISGAGKTFTSWPQMQNNIIPYIPGEEKKSETEPLKIWGKVTPCGIASAATPNITARCARVSILYGHTAYVTAKIKHSTTSQEIIERWSTFSSPPHLPSSPQKPIYYCSEVDRPQPTLDCMREKGMAISVGQLQCEVQKQISFCSLAHNTILGAAGGAIWATELAFSQNLIHRRGQ